MAETPVEGMVNVVVDIEENDNIAVITVDLSKRMRPSTSGKTTIIASSKGNKEIAPGIFMGLNVYVYP